MSCSVSIDGEELAGAVVRYSEWTVFFGGPSDDLLIQVLMNDSLPLLMKGNCCSVLGEVYMRLDRLEDAETSLVRAVELHQQAKDVLGEGSDRGRLGELYMRLDRLEDAETSLLCAVELYQQAKDIRSEQIARSRLEELYMRLVVIH
jgi:tetratricopeptide (TPR) repeat protein